jgi:hypothetical protein
MFRCVLFLISALWMSGLNFARASPPCSEEDSPFCGKTPHSQLPTADFDFVCVTVSRSGAFGVGLDASFAKAITTAVSQCRVMADGAGNCGSQFEVARGQWIIATMCGDQPMIVTDQDFANAQVQIQNAEIGMELLSGQRQPSCTHLVTVSPYGTVTAQGRKIATRQ